MYYILILMMLFTAPLMAEEKTPAIPAAPCSSDKHHQFDFWIGDWTVTFNGKVAGTNSIQPILNGCVLLENWLGAGGVEGKSFNLYEEASGKWHQTWVDTSGSMLELTGGIENGNMVLQGQSPSPDGKGQTTQRITWTPNSDGTVRQLWDSTQDGQTWTVMFDGLYARVKE